MMSETCRVVCQDKVEK